jgi:uncharacterized membrane protein/membrane-bound inhibitor of C-type lysozyme
MGTRPGRETEAMLRASISILFLALLLAGCGRSEVPSEPPPGVTPAAELAEERMAEDALDLPPRGPEAGGFTFEAYAYDCGDIMVVSRAGDDELKLTLPDRRLTLPQVTSASGARYLLDDVGFWSKNIDSAVLTLDGEDIPCTLNRRETPWVDARARGALFRGVGQEPGWHLEIHPERMVLVYRYGERRAVAPNPGSTVDPDQPVRRWQATTEAHTLEVTVEDRACTDVMSGDFYPSTVVVRLDGVKYSGCGRDLGLD